MTGQYNQASEEEQARRLASAPGQAGPPAQTWGDGSRTASSGYPQRGDGTSEMGDRAQEMMGEGRERAQEMMGEGRDRAAEGAERAASTLRERSREQGGMAGEMGEKVAGSMESAAGYLRRQDGDMMDDVEHYVRLHPMQAVAAAVGAGFLVGRLLR